MTDREAMFALAAPEPEPFRQVALTHADYAARRAHNRRRNEALKHARDQAEAASTEGFQIRTGGRTGA